MHMYFKLMVASSLQMSHQPKQVMAKQQQCEVVGGLPKGLDGGRLGSLGAIMVTVPQLSTTLTFLGLGFWGSSSTVVTGKLSSLYTSIEVRI